MANGKINLNDVYEKIGQIEAYSKISIKKQELLFKEIKDIRNDINMIENRSLKNERDVKNIYKNAGILGSISGFFVGIIMWLFGKMLK